MTSRIAALCIAAMDPQGLARFWGGVLGRVADPADPLVLLPDDAAGFRIRFLPTTEAKSELNQMHFDLTSASLEDQERAVARALELGAQHLDVGQGPDAEHVVLADPEGNEFDIIEPGNAFLAGCGVIGALASDGSQAVGYFWSEALGWPLVWDQDEETAIQSPHGGPKISWGGPPLRERSSRSRLHFDLAATDGSDGSDVAAEVERLVALGATRVGQRESGRVELLDPDGNEFCVVPGV
jgi:catechol 2,3-dioxygenase-like lactoylglutathione lyase family enzyme